MGRDRFLISVTARQANKVGGGRRAPQGELSRTQRWGLSREIVATYDRKDVEKSNYIGEPFTPIIIAGYGNTEGSPDVTSGPRRDYTLAPHMTTQYLLGMTHDGTRRHSTYRIATNSNEFAKFLQKGIRTLSVGAWIYKEGKSRNLWIVEFPKKILKEVIIRSREDKIEYIQGYFDAEGGIAKHSSVRYYLYFCQKDKKDLLQVRRYLEEVGIICGKIHNPSKKVDPNYWRFYISAQSYTDFAQIIGSDHPEKRRFMRMKI